MNLVSFSEAFIWMITVFRVICFGTFAMLLNALPSVAQESCRALNEESRPPFFEDIQVSTLETCYLLCRVATYEGFDAAESYGDGIPCFSTPEGRFSCFNLAMKSVQIGDTENFAAHPVLFELFAAIGDEISLCPEVEEFRETFREDEQSLSYCIGDVCFRLRLVPDVVSQGVVSGSRYHLLTLEFPFVKDDL